MKNIAIFASGQGTNAQAIIEYFRNHASIQVALIVTNNPQSGVLKMAKDNKIISAIVTKEGLNNPQLMSGPLDTSKIDMIVLAGFLLMVPEFLLQKFPKRIINIHPALLPKYGGKGMYGMNVHESIIADKETSTGITIHYVNERYDEGEIITQQNVSVEATDTPESIAEKVHQLEHKWYPQTIEKLLS